MCSSCHYAQTPQTIKSVTDYLIQCHQQASWSTIFLLELPLAARVLEMKYDHRHSETHHLQCQPKG